MAIQFTFAHALGLAEARRRLFEEAARQDVEVSVDPGDPNRGEVTAGSPLGKVSARFVLGAAGIEVEVTKKPAFVPEGLVRGALEDGLAKLLG